MIRESPVGLGGSDRVWEGLGGSRRFWEGLGGSGRIQTGFTELHWSGWFQAVLGGSRRVQ